ncbi:MAG: hypothetical protein AAFP19_04980 [Bacteroidota bacterium]
MKTIYPLITILCLLFSVSGCVEEEIPDLTYTIFDDEDYVFFDVTKVEFEPVTNFYKNVRVNYDFVYDQLTAEQQERILKVMVYEGIRLRFEIDPARDFFLDIERRVGSTICYELAFKTDDEDIRGHYPFCVEIRE